MPLTSDLSNMTWGCCNMSDLDDSRGYVCCMQCKKYYHNECLLTSGVKEIALGADWACPLCSLEKQRRSKHDNAPIKASTSSSSNKASHPNQPKSTRRVKRPAISSSPEMCVEEVEAPEYINKDDLRSVVTDVVRAELKDMFTQFQNSFSNMIDTRLKAVTDELKDLKTSMNFISEQYEDFAKEMNSCSSSVKKLKEDSSSMQEMIKDQNNKINQLEQRARMTNLELQCIPENKNENLINLVTRIGEVIGCIIEQDKILYCTRTAKANPSSTRPRNVIVQFSSPRVRDSFLAASISYNKKHKLDKLNTSLLGIGGEKKPIFITEHLSPTNKALHAAARLKARELDFKYVWVKEGRIFMRKDDGSDYKLIKSMDCLNKLK
ncbi:uncharacterized protein LOC114352726 [Ostrinia furnacalis]|uniref:uncharacterized protein LOC114352726 n=1 Tax=Ostrinia furnacalis TaxID=93504 RepID=UPI00103A3498|nr:uncharacterized protein LOC114352726 [Ostrinia furnacalis]